MNSFRVVGTKFRILKGGKIGLSMSIALIGSMLTLSSMKANAATDNYFSNNVDMSHTYTDGGITIVNYRGLGDATEVRTISDGLSDDVVFLPYGVASSYIGINANADGTIDGVFGATLASYALYSKSTLSGNDYYRTYGYEINKVEGDTYTINFNLNAGANNITKLDGIDYNVDVTSYTYTTSTVSSSLYTANLIFAGSNTISGNTDIDNGNIQLNGEVTFQGSVESGLITINTTGTGNFNTLSGTTNSDIVFGADGIANLNNGLTGDVTTNTVNTGTLNLVGSNNQTVSGTVGSTNALKDVNSGVNGTTSTFTGIVNSQNVTNTGSGTTIFQDNVTATNVNVNAGTSTFQDNLTATTTTISTGTGNFNTVSGTTTSNLQFTDNGIANLNTGLTGNVTTTADNKGTLNLVGSNNQTVTGTVGGVGVSLAEVNAGVNGSTSTFNSNVYASNLNMTGTGTVILNSDLTGNVVATGNNQGILTTTGLNKTITGNIGSSTSLDLNTLNIGSDTDATNYSTTTINGNVFANSTVLNNNGTINSSELILASGKNITSTITTADANMGILTLAGGIQTVTGTVGGVGASLEKVSSGAMGATSTFVNNVYANTVENTGTGATTFQDNVTATNVNVNAGTSTFQDNLTATTTTITTGTGTFNTLSGTTNSDIVFGADGIANLNNGLTGDVTTNTVNTGTLNLVGSNNQTVSGTVGSTNALKDVNSGVNGTTSTFTGTVNSQNVTNTGSGTTIFQDDVTATNVNVNAGTSTFQDNLTATTTTITTGTGNFNTLSGTTNSDIVFGADGIANLNNGLTGDVTTNTVNTGTLNLVGSNNQTVSGTVGSTNALKDVNSGVNGTTSTFTGTVNSQNVTNTGSGTTIFQDDVTATNVNVNAGTSTFQDNLTATTTTITTGTGTFNTLSGTTNSDIVFGADGIANLNNGLTGDVTTNTVNTGTLNLVGSNNQTVSGTVGSTNALKDVNSGVNGTTSTFTGTVNSQNVTNTGSGTTIFQDDVTATNVNVNAGTSTFQDNLTATTTTITTGTGNFNTVSGTTTSDIVFGGIGEANLNNGLTGNVITDANNQGTLNLVGNNNQIVTGTVGDITNSLKIVNSGVNATSSIFNDKVYAQTINNTGTGATTFQDNVTATNVNVNAGTSTFQDNLTATTTTITTGTGNFNTVSGTTTSDIVFGGIGEANLNNGLTGNINFANYDATVNVTSGNLTGNVTATLTNGNLNILGTTTVSGTVGTNTTDRISEINGSASTDTTFKENVFTNNVNVNDGEMAFEKSLNATTATIASGTANFNTVSGTTTSDIVFSNTGTANLNNGLIGNIDFAGNDATVNVSDGKGILGSIETLATNNTGIVNFKGDGTISGNIGSSIYGIKELNINTNNEQNNTDGVLVTFDAIGRELYADVVSLRNNATLTLSDGVDIINTGSDNIIVTVDSTNKGILTFQGTSNIEGEVGQSNNVLNTINAGATGKIVTFDDMVYATNLKYSDNGKVVLNGDNSSNANAEGLKGRVDFDSKAGTLEFGDDVNLTTGITGTQFINANNATLAFNGSSIVIGNLGSENGTNDTFKTINAGTLNETVKFEDNIYMMDSLNLSSDGKVQIADGSYVKRNTNSATTGAMITTSTDGFGDLEYLGTTVLHSDIGTSLKKLNNVTFASTGTASNIYNQDIDKNIYALNTHIGNGSNETILNIKDDLTFGGNLDLRSNSTLNISDYDVIVNDNLNVVSNSTLKFKVYTTDISNGEAVENPKSGSITANTLTMANDIKINIEYDGSWYGAGKYNLITATEATTDYYGTEENGLVSDNSIIDSVIRKDGSNLTLFADRTGGGSYNPEDLYIIKSDIGEHYSNGASQSLAGYANEAKREGALADIIRQMEELEGVDVTDEKKEEMIKTQKLLAPNPNNSTIKSSLMASNSVLSTVGERINDIRYSTNSIPYNYSGLSSGNNTLDYALWIKGMGAKATQSKVEDYDGYDSTTYGFVMGMDKTFRNDVIIGLSAAYSTTQINQTDFREDDTSDTKSNQVTTYIAKEFENTYVNGLLSYATHSTDSIRTANSGKLSASVDADQLTAKIEAGHNINFGKDSTLTPFVSVEYGTLNQKAYTEKGTKYQNDALKVDSIKLNKGNVAVGAKVSTQLNLGDALIIPEAKIAVYNSFGDKDIDIKAQYTGGGNKFVTPSQELSGSGYNAGLSVRTPLSESTSLTIGVDYDRSKDGDFEGYSGNVAFRLNF